MPGGMMRRTWVRSLWAFNARAINCMVGQVKVGDRQGIISKKSLNFENSGELWRTLEYSGVLKVQRFFADDHGLLLGTPGSNIGGNGDSRLRIRG